MLREEVEAPSGTLGTAVPAKYAAFGYPTVEVPSGVASAGNDDYLVVAGVTLLRAKL